MQSSVDESAGADASPRTDGGPQPLPLFRRMGHAAVPQPASAASPHSPMQSLDVSMDECRVFLTASQFTNDHLPSPMLPDAFRQRAELRLDPTTPTVAPQAHAVPTAPGSRSHQELRSNNCGSVPGSSHRQQQQQQHQQQREGEERPHFLSPASVGDSSGGPLSPSDESCFSPVPHYRDRNILPASPTASMHSDQPDKEEGSPISPS